MKNSSLFLSALSLTLILALGCKKSGVESAASAKLTASKSVIKLNEPVILSLASITTKDSVHWSATPSGYSSQASSGNQATFLFTKPGTYVVSGNNASTNVTVKDSVYVPPVPQKYNTLPLTGDVITLQAHWFSSSDNADSTRLYFTAITKNSYGCDNSRLNYTYNLDQNNAFSINFINVQQPQGTGCAVGNLPLLSNFAFAPNKTGSSFGNSGTYPLTVTLNGRTYTGSILVTSTAVTFNWTNDAVIITPKQITR